VLQTTDKRTHAHLQNYLLLYVYYFDFPVNTSGLYVVCITVSAHTFAMTRHSIMVGSSIGLARCWIGHCWLYSMHHLFASK